MIRSSLPMFREYDTSNLSVLWSFRDLEGFALERATLGEGVESFLLGESHYDPGCEGLEVVADIEAPSHTLFGSVATKGSKVSVVLEWLSQESLNRRIGEPSPLVDEGDFSVARVSLRIPQGVLRRQFRIRLLLVLDTAESPEPGMAKTRGTILGSLETPVFRLDGKGMDLFPVLEIDDPDQPAWWVEDSIVDPETDTLDGGSVQIVLNRHWHAFHADLSSSGAVTPLQATVWAAAIVAVMSKTATFRDAWQAVLQPSRAGQEGTIVDLVRGWRDEFGWLDHPIRASERLQRRIQLDLLRRSA